MSSDLVGAKLPLNNPFLQLFGQTTNVVQGNLPAYTNLSYGLGSVTDASIGTAGVMTSVAVPVDPGAVISKITYIVGATAASTPSHAWVALYSGVATPALLAQSADSAGAAIAASAVQTISLATAQLITNAIAPNGYIYAAIMHAGTAAASAASIGTPTAVFYPWATNAPLGVAVTSGSSLGATAPTTIASSSAKANAPVVFLT